MYGRKGGATRDIPEGRSPCAFHYVDFGSNKGDSILDFVERRVNRVDRALSIVLEAAMPSGWSPEAACVHGFEPNPKWSSTLTELEKRLRDERRVGSVVIRTQTALSTGAPGDGRLKDGGRDSIGASIAQGGTSGVPVSTDNFVAVLRELPWPELPIVVRMDVEGSEYHLLRALAASGLGVTRNIFIAVEWHRFIKHKVLVGNHSAFMQRLDKGFAHFNRAPKYASTDGASSLFENQEKTLGFMLAAANIRLADFYRLNFTKAELAAVSQQRRRRKRS